MPIKMQKTSDRSFALTIEDRFDPNEDYLVEVIDMDTYDGVSKIDGKPFTSLKWIYRVFDADGAAFIDQVSGSAWEGVAFSSMALGGNAKGRTWASAFLGHELSDEECDAIADDFDGAIIGKRARVSFKVVEKKTENGVLGKNLEWALVRPVPPKRASPPPSAGPAPRTPVQEQPSGGRTRQSAAERRAALEAELAAMNDEDDVDDVKVDDDDIPF